MMTLSDAKDEQRRSDVNTILNATYQYAIDNRGNIPEGIPTGTPKEICATKSPVKPCVNLNALAGSYLVAIPSDPDAEPGHTGYSIIMNPEDGRITVEAMMAENENGISITR
jgi:hypothetical protein